MAALLQVKGLTKAFGGLVAVNGDLACRCRRAKCLGLIGPNGSGKTTLLNLIAGVIRPDAGSIRMDGEDVTRLPNHLRVRKRINRTFQLVRMPAKLSAIQTVMAGVLYGAGERRAFKDAGYEAAGLLGELNLLLKADRRLDQLTYIEQKRVELARALATAATRVAARRMAFRLEPERVGGRHFGGVEPRGQGNGRHSGRACDDGGARALPSRHGDERRRRRSPKGRPTRCCATPR